MQKFLMAIMLVIGFVGFNSVSEAGPLCRLVHRAQEWRESRCTTAESCVNTTNSTAVVKSSGCSCGSSYQCVGSRSCSSGSCYPTPVRNFVGNVVEGVVNSVSTCPNGNCRR